MASLVSLVSQGTGVPIAPKRSEYKTEQEPPLGRDEWSPPIKKRYKVTPVRVAPSPPRPAGRHPSAGGLIA